jgi:hypothetical protein
VCEREKEGEDLEVLIASSNDVGIRAAHPTLYT